jgi:two-component system heavy metal sensor histidine kinase CusS
MGAALASRLKGPWSLATRLAIGFSTASFLLLVCCTAVPYWALTYNLDREDNESIVEKFRSVADLIARHPIPAAGVSVDDALAHAIEPEFSEPIFVRVLRERDGRPLIESKGMTPLLPAGLFPEATTYTWPDSRPPALADKHIPKHRHMRLLAGKVAVQGTSEPLIIQVALDRTPEAQLLGAFRSGLAALVTFGLVVSAVAGFAIARRGLRPVRRMAAAVSQIGSSNLNERLKTDQVPAELSSLATAFNSMLARLEDNFSRLSQFSSDIAHELRTPVGNVRGLVELTLSKTDRPLKEREELLSDALDECGHLAKLIDSLLFLARSENPQTLINRQLLNLRTELEAMVEFYEPAATEAGIHLAVSGPPDVPAWIDKLLVQRAVANLVENAITHTAAGGSITLSAARGEVSATLTVSDAGRGIPPEHLAKIFDRFHRVDASRSTHTGGAGLGLAMVRSIALMHGGTAEARAGGNGGAEFTLVFPDEPHPAPR